MGKENNVILVTIDCLRPDHMSCLGYCENTTPYIDNIARKGALFRQAISNGPNTYCSFPSIMTSTYAMMNSLGKEIGFPPKWIFLSTRNVTLAEVLRRQGYSTAAFHSNPWISAFFHYDRGFDFFDDSLNSFRSSYFRRELNRSANVSYYISQIVGLYKRLRNKEEMNANWLNQKALSWLQEHRKEKFFVWIHHMDVHAPLISPELPFFQRVGAIKLEYKLRRYSSVSNNELKTLVNLYDKEIRYVDNQIGQFIYRLEEMGISSENTYFIVLSLKINR